MDHIRGGSASSPRQWGFLQWQKLQKYCFDLQKPALKMPSLRILGGKKLKILVKNFSPVERPCDSRGSLAMSFLFCSQKIFQPVNPGVFRQIPVWNYIKSPGFLPQSPSFPALALRGIFLKKMIWTTKEKERWCCAITGDIGPAGVQAIFHALQGNTTLRGLNLLGVFLFPCTLLAAVPNWTSCCHLIF